MDKDDRADVFTDKQSIRIVEIGSISGSQIRPDEENVYIVLVYLYKTNHRQRLRQHTQERQYWTMQKASYWSLATLATVISNISLS